MNAQQSAAILGAFMEIAGDDDSSGEDLLGELLEGEDDASGEDSLAVLGEALKPRKSAGKALLQRAIAARRLAGSQVLSAKQPSSSGVQAIGFVSLAIAAGAAAVITTQ